MMALSLEDVITQLTTLGLKVKILDKGKGSEVRGGTEIVDVSGMDVYKNAFVIKRSRGVIVLTLPGGNTRQEIIVDDIEEAKELIVDYYFKESHNS